MAECTIVCNAMNMDRGKWARGIFYVNFFVWMCVPAVVCMHPPSVHRGLIAIPSGRQDSVTLLRDIYTFIRLYWSSQCITKRGSVPIFHRSFTLQFPCCFPILPFFPIFTHCITASKLGPAALFSVNIIVMPFLGLLRPMQREKDGLEKVERMCYPFPTNGCAILMWV